MPLNAGNFTPQLLHAVLSLACSATAQFGQRSFIVENNASILFFMSG
jgi:hypothetical protein